MDKQDAVGLVLNAWCIEGPSPLLHNQAKKKLKKEWPTLYVALCNLTLAYKGQSYGYRRPNERKDDVR